MAVKTLPETSGQSKKIIFIKMTQVCFILFLITNAIKLIIYPTSLLLANCVESIVIH